MSAQVGSVSVQGPDDEPITLHAFPNDEPFMRDIRRAVLAVATAAKSHDELRDLLQTALQAWYPRLRVQPRAEIAGLSGDRVLWYVLRDGRLEPRRAQIDRMHAALSDARATTADSERAIERAHAALAVAREPRRPRRSAIAGDAPQPRSEPVDEP